jgi:hypothetical protein
VHSLRLELWDKRSIKNPKEKASTGHRLKGDQAKTPRLPAENRRKKEDFCSERGIDIFYR